MNRIATAVVAVALGAGILVPAVSADPSHNIQSPTTLTCGNQQIVVNPGTVTNRSHQAFVVSSNGTISSTSIFVVNSLAFTDSTGTVVIFDTAPGLTGLVTCTADVGGGVTLTARGFFTPRA